MKRPWLFYISPCVLAAVFCLYAIIKIVINHTGGEGWGYLFLMFLAPAFFVLLLADFMIKAFTNGNVLYIWIIESILIAMAVILFTFL